MSAPPSLCVLPLAYIQAHRFEVLEKFGVFLGGRERSEVEVVVWVLGLGKISSFFLYIGSGT